MRIQNYNPLTVDHFEIYTEPILRYDSTRANEIRQLVKDLRLEYRRMLDGLAEYFYLVDKGEIDTSISYDEWFETGNRG